MNYLVTGGAGFIGANYIKYVLRNCKDCNIIVLDKLTYAGNLGTIKDDLKDIRVSFYKGDICNKELVENIFMNHDIDFVVNFAAESHVDRSIEDPGIFLKTNILGTQTLMDVAKAFWQNGIDDFGYPIYESGKKFLQVSTDEVYGHLDRDIPEGKLLEVSNSTQEVALKHREVSPKTFGSKYFSEETPLAPRSPYATSKTGADMLVRAYAETYHFPINITRCSNNYGPFHFPEKLIPLIIKNILAGNNLPVYGDGKQVRDWLYVDDHCKGIELVLRKGRLNEVYNIGGFNEELNINIVKTTIDIVKDLIFVNEQVKEVYKSFTNITYKDCNYNLITFVQDRLGHDARYAIDPTKCIEELGFYPETPFTFGIRKTILWYLKNQKWVEEVTSGDYQKYYDEMYGKR